MGNATERAELEAISLESLESLIGALGAGGDTETLAGQHVKDLPKAYIYTRLVADLCSWSKRLMDASPGDEAGRQSLQALYDNIRAELLNVVSDADMCDAVAFGMPYCGPDASLSQLGIATEIASTYLIALTEVETYVKAKQLESLGAAAAMQRASEVEDDGSPKGHRPGTYL
jgi:hypothetical protein